MSHTLHRQGTRGNLAKDFVVLSMSAKGINEEGSAAKLQEFLRIALRCKPVNLGDMKTGNMYQQNPEEIIQRVKDTSIVHAVFTDANTVAEVLQEVKDADLGMSVVVSGLLKPVGQCCRRIGRKPAPHTIEYSLGVWGRTDRLPGDSVLELSTMCGHGMVAFNLIFDTVEEVRKGRVTCEEASRRLAKPCVCGVFNPARATELLKAMAGLPRD